MFTCRDFDVLEPNCPIFSRSVVEVGDATNAPWNVFEAPEDPSNSSCKIVPVDHELIRIYKFKIKNTDIGGAELVSQVKTLVVGCVPGWVEVT
jgi:hypothetical protein